MLTMNPRSIERLASFPALQVIFSVLVSRDYFTYHVNEIVTEYERYLPHMFNSHDLNHFTYWTHIDVRGLCLSKIMPLQVAMTQLDRSTRMANKWGVVIGLKNKSASNTILDEEEKHNLFKSMLNEQWQCRVEARTVRHGGKKAWHDEAEENAGFVGIHRFELWPIWEAELEVASSSKCAIEGCLATESDAWARTNGTGVLWPAHHENTFTPTTPPFSTIDVPKYNPADQDILDKLPLRLKCSIPQCPLITFAGTFCWCHANVVDDVRGKKRKIDEVEDEIEDEDENEDEVEEDWEDEVGGGDALSSEFMSMEEKALMTYQQRRVDPGRICIIRGCTKRNNKDIATGGTRQQVTCEDHFDYCYSFGCKREPKTKQHKRSHKCAVHYNAMRASAQRADDNHVNERG
jgi:hypothetical protein